MTYAQWSSLWRLSGSSPVCEARMYPTVIASRSYSKLRPVWASLEKPSLKYLKCAEYPETSVTGHTLAQCAVTLTAWYICSSRGSSVDDTGSRQTNWLLACSPSNYSLLLVLTCRSHRWLGKCCCETSTSTRSHLLRRCNVPSFDVLWNPQPQRGSSTLRAEQKRLLQQHFHTSQFAIMLQYEQLWTGINTVYEYKMLVRKSLSKRQFR